MLILRRKKSESILIGDNIRITVVDCAADGVRLAIDAPKQISILREELSKAELENKSSIAPDFDTVSNLQNTLLARLKKMPAAADTAGVQADENGSEKAESDSAPETAYEEKKTEQENKTK
jgi:carbon storage regulator